MEEFGFWLTEMEDKLVTTTKKPETRVEACQLLATTKNLLEEVETKEIPEEMEDEDDPKVQEFVGRYGHRSRKGFTSWSPFFEVYGQYAKIASTAQNWSCCSYLHAYRSVQYLYNFVSVFAKKSAKFWLIFVTKGKRSLEFVKKIIIFLTPACKYKQTQ